MAVDENSAAILGSNLRRLRLAKKISQAYLAEAAGLSRVGYRNIETGASSPRADTLMRLAKALDVRLEDLVSPMRELSAVRFRARKRMTSREMILAEVGRWLDDYAYLEELLDDHQPWAFADVASKVRRKRGKNRSVEAARLAREAVELESTDVIRDICGLLEDNGVKLFTPQVASEGFFGLSLGPRGDGPAVVVNTWDRITVERWIFTAAHELGHILLHQDAFDVKQGDENANEEREADLFASHFLMPNDVFWEEYEQARGLSLFEKVLKLKGIFRVSWKTVVYRLHEQAAPGNNVWASFYLGAKQHLGRSVSASEEVDGLSDDGWPSPSPVMRIADEPENLRRSAFMEDRLQRLVRRALDDDKITMSRAAEILRIPTSEMRSLARSWLD